MTIFNMLSFYICGSTGLQMSVVSLSTLTGMLFDATALLVLMFNISFPISFQFTSPYLNFLVTATLLGCLLYFLVVISTGSEYPTVFEILLHPLMSNLSTASSKKLLRVPTTFGSSEIMASF